MYMYFCIMNENFRKSASQKKFIELEVFNDESIENFKMKLLIWKCTIN